MDNVPNDIIQYFYKLIVNNLNLVMIYRVLRNINHKYYDSSLEYLDLVKQKVKFKFNKHRLYREVTGLGDTLLNIDHLRRGKCRYWRLRIKCQYCKNEYHKSKYEFIRDYCGGCCNCRQLLIKN
jgi:hypothetical protein